MTTSKAVVRRPAGVVLSAAVTMAVLLTILSNRYGFHRDELYFRMLTPASGYVDQPPLIVWLAHLTRLLADEPWAIRIPATLAAAASVVVIAEITRRLGGGSGAQALSAWGYAFAAAPLMLGHLLLTSTIDLLLLPAIVLCALRTADSPRWWLAVGLLGGLATYNRWVVAVIAVGLVLGLLLTGGWRRLLSKWVLAGTAVALATAAPNLLYQVTHGFPQLAMGAALAAEHAAEVRPQVPLMLVLLLGPPLLPIWLLGFAELLRRPAWREARWLAVAFAVLVLFTVVGGAQVHYLMGLLPVMYAAGCVPVAEWAQHRNWRHVLVVAGIATNAAASILISLPVIPAQWLGDTPVPDVNPVVGDTVGWPAYVTQIEAISAEADGVPVVTSNYGEAGALARFGTSPVHSGHNALWDNGPPSGDTVVIVGARFERLQGDFAHCVVRVRLTSGLSVNNEEEGQPVAICRGPRAPWAELWARWGHLS